MWWARWCSYLAVPIIPALFSFCQTIPLSILYQAKVTSRSGQKHWLHKTRLLTKQISLLCSFREQMKIQIHTYKLSLKINHYYWPGGWCGLHEAPSVVLQASSVRPITTIFFTHNHQHLEQRKMGRSVYFSFFPFLSARHPPHLTRLFPHPGIFSLSRQLLDHLLQSRNSNVRTKKS